VSGIVTTEFRQPVTARHATPPSPLRSAVASFWLDAMFRSVGGSAVLARIFRPIAARGAYGASRTIRTATAANARRIFGPSITRAEQKRFGRQVVSHFYDFVCDVGKSLHLSPQELAAQIEGVDGHENFLAARAMGKGAIIATAHMGSFEAGAAALLEHEKAIHVVFKRDDTRFEKVRCSLRQKLGVTEAPVDDGWSVWLRLRDALQRDEVVMVQADRVMPGQKGCKVPFLHGHLLLPTGPIKLALASGAPIVPVFAVRSERGAIRIHVEPAITPEPSELEPNPALLQLAGVLEKYVRAYPDQWLLFQKAFCEDTGL
jgi:lauroyl/myristoyl acyltransferase